MEIPGRSGHTSHWSPELITYSSRIASPKLSKEPASGLDQCRDIEPSHAAPPPPLSTRRSTRASGAIKSPKASGAMKSPSARRSASAAAVSEHSASVRMAGLLQLPNWPEKSCMPA